MSDLILTHHDDNVFEIILNRPDKRNAITMEMWTQFDAALTAATQTEGVRAVLIRGEGPAFSAGIDVTTFMLLPQQYGAEWQRHMRRITDEFQQVLNHLERLELPTVALLHGYCLGLGMELALACDLRMAAEGTKLGLPEVRLGLIPDVGGTTRLTRLIGPGRAKELIFTGGQIDVSLAQQWGLVNHITTEFELRPRGVAFVDALKLTAPLAVGMAKRVIDGLADIDRGLMLEGWAQSQLIQSADFQEAVEAFMMKRPPQFKGK